MFYNKISSENKLKLQMLFFICMYWIILIRIVFVQNFFGFYSFTPEAYTPKAMIILRQSLISSTSAGLLMGLVTGLIELYVFPKKLHHSKFIIIFALKMCSYLISLLLISVSVAIFYHIHNTDLNNSDIAYTIFNMLRSKGFLSFLYAGFFMSVIINMTLYIHNYIGFGNFMPMITGKYYIPKEEDRIFLFIDLKSSSFMAEKLGHKNYSKLLQKCFRELDYLIPQFNGTVYQFVGDEAVITWKSKNKINYSHAVSLLLKFQEVLENKTYEYYKEYEVMPHFKGAIHSGNVMVAEVGGTMKKEVAYHGDVLNTVSRIMEHCKPLEYDLLISGEIQKHLDNNKNYSITNIGSIALRGKSKMQQVYGIIPIRL